MVRDATLQRHDRPTFSLCGRDVQIDGHGGSQNGAHANLNGSDVSFLMEARVRS